jgi:hypothetical protein
VNTSALSVPDPAGPPSPPDSAQREIAYPSELNRWLPLVKWLRGNAYAYFLTGRYPPFVWR